MLVTRSAHSTSMSWALRPVSTTCVISGFSVEKKFNDFVNVEILVPERDVDFVQKHEANFRVADQGFGLCPARLRRSNVAFAILGFPGETLSAGHPGHLVGEVVGEKVAFLPFPKRP